MNKPFGLEYLLDLYDCDPIHVNDKQFCFDFLNKAVEVLEVHKQADPVVIQTPTTYINKNGEEIDASDKAGLSAWVPLLESGIQIHTLVPKNFISIDFYTCGRLDKDMQENLTKFATEAFGAKKIESQFLERGKNYYS
jgi:S-adenosylmethionine/arginine decarboxylase-like enzyme